MTRLLFILLLFPVMACADHHRQHTIDRIDEIQYFIEGARGDLAHWVYLVGTLTPKEASRIDHAFRTLENIEYVNKNTRQHLILKTKPLESLRRDYNQPQIDVGPHSASWRNATIGYNMANIGGNHPDADAWLFAALRNIFIIERMLQGVMWHIDDAIREEVYTDPDFICSGPGNHCDN